MLTQKLNIYLENSKNTFTGFFRDKKSLLLLAILIIIFSGVFYFVYNNYIYSSSSKIRYKDIQYYTVCLLFSISANSSIFLFISYLPTLLRPLRWLR